MSFTEHFKKEVESGLLGLNEGIPLPLTRFNETTCGIQRNQAYLIGGATGSGKSTFADEMFIYTPFEYYKSVKGTDKEIDLKIDYFSFEMEKQFIIAKGVNRLLLRNNIKLPGGINYILSRGKNKLNNEHYELIKKHLDYFEELENVLNIYDIQENPTGIRNKIIKTKEEMGKYEYEQMEFEGKMYNVPKSYKFNHKNAFHIPMIDHIALTTSERGYKTKEIIDKLSEYFIRERKFSSSPVIVQQLNYDIDNPERVKTGKISPLLADFGDSKYTTRDSPIVITLFNPAKAGIEEYPNKGRFKLPVHRFYGNLVILSLLKNRYGESGLEFPLWFRGGYGSFVELPQINYILDNIDKISDFIQKFHNE